MFRWSRWHVEDFLRRIALALFVVAFLMVMGVGCGIRVSAVRGFRVPVTSADGFRRFFDYALGIGMWFGLVGLCAMWIWTLPGALLACAVQGYGLGVALGTLLRFSLPSIGILVVYALPDFLLRGMPLCFAAVMGCRAAFLAWQLPFDARRSVREPYLKVCGIAFLLSLPGCAWLAWVAPVARAWG